MTKRSVRIAPSLLSADFGAFRQAAMDCIEAGADALHYDVMDGIFVPNITFGTHPIAALRRDFDVHFEVHLMIQSPERYIEDFARAGADTIIIQPESTVHLQRTLALIKQNGKQSGVALNPSTPLNVLEYVLDDIDHLLIMTVNPGFSGQKFIPAMRTKIADAARMIESSDKDIVLEIDGGVTADNAQEMIDLGATALVSGSGVFGYPGGVKCGIKALLAAVASP